jgi:hypothetical protein
MSYEEIPENFVHINPAALAISSKVAIIDEFKKTLQTVKSQLGRIYNFVDSRYFKDIETRNPGIIQLFSSSVLYRVEDKLNKIIRLLDLLVKYSTGGGWFSKKPTPIVPSNLDKLLDKLEELEKAEIVKFEALFSGIKMFISHIEKGSAVSEAVAYNISMKIETFDIITNDIIAVIETYNKMPRNEKIGGQKTRKHKTSKRRL